MLHFDNLLPIHTDIDNMPGINKGYFTDVLTWSRLSDHNLVIQMEHYIRHMAYAVASFNLRIA